MVTEKRTLDRTQALEPFLSKLSALGSVGGQVDRPLHITIGSRRLEIDPWERETLAEIFQGASTGSGERSDGWRILLAEGVALQAKCLLDIDKMQGNGPTSGAAHPEVKTDLEANATLGCELMVDLQTEISQLVQAGQMEQAKMLTRSRNKLSHSVSGLGEFIGDDGLQRARSQILRRAPEETTPSTDGTMVQELLKLEHELEKSQAPPATKAAWAIPTDPTSAAMKDLMTPTVIISHSVPKSKSKASILSLILIAVVAVWLIFFVWPRATRIEYPVLTISDFRTITEIDTIVARPPSLFVQVDSREWRRMNEEQQRHVVQKVGNILTGAGYTGAHFRDGDRTVAQWLQKTGVAIYSTPRKR